MTIDLFIGMLVAMCAVSTLLTEAVKKAFENARKQISANLLALIDAVAVGGIGSVGVYLVIGIPFTVNSVIAIAAMILCIWVGSMLSYDKVVQLVTQILKVKGE